MSDLLNIDTKSIFDQLNTILDDKLSTLKSVLIAAIEDPIKIITKELQELQKSYSFLSDEYEDLKRESQSQKTSMNELKNENVKLSQSLQQLSAKYNTMELAAKSCNVEFQGVPEKKEENVVNIVKKICEVTSGTQLNNDAIMSCRRVAKLNPHSTRPRNILLTLPSPRQRDQVLSNIQRYNKANSKDKLNSLNIGIPGEKSQIYAVEHLPLELKSLQAEARKIAKEKLYKFVWVRFGKIFVKKNEQSKPIFVRNKDSLKLII